MSPRPVRLIVLDPGTEVCRARNASREPDEQFEFDAYEWLQEDMEAEFGDIGWWLDTASMTADQTAEKIEAGVASTTAILPDWSAWLRGLHGA